MWPGAAYGLAGVFKADYEEPRLLALTVGDASGRADVLTWYASHLSDEDKKDLELELASWAASSEGLNKRAKV
eukprot:5461012-Amphidinium_carterae.1